jgi:hypothetical protein
MALAEFDASRCDGDYGYDEEHACWWTRDNGRNYHFAIEPAAPADQAGVSVAGSCATSRSGLSSLTLRIKSRGCPQSATGPMHLRGWHEVLS